MEPSTPRKTPDNAKIADLYKSDLNVIFFRVSFDLGLAVEEHLQALVHALAATRNPSVFHFVCEKSESWADSHISKFGRVDEPKYGEQLTAVRDCILADRTYETDNLSAVYHNIAIALREREPHELAHTLRQKRKGVYSVLTSAINRYGGPLSKARWESCKPASLVFRNGSARPTMCSFERETGNPDGVITVHIGNHIGGIKDKGKGALRVYFNIDFNFFHEYLSHSFAIWQKGYELVEGYLMWAAKEMFFKERNDQLRRLFVEDTFQYSSDPARTAEAVASWFQITLDDKFLTFLLEWSADPDCLEYSDQSDFVALRLISDTCVGDGQSTAEVRSAFNSEDPRATLAQLRAMAEGRLPIKIPPFTRNLI